MADIKQLIEKFWKGKLDQQGTRSLDKLLSENGPDLQMQLKAAYEDQLSSGIISEKIDPLASERILNALHLKIQSAEIRTVHHASRFRLYPVLKWAACFFLIAAASIFAFYDQQQAQPTGVQPKLVVYEQVEGKNYSNHQQKDIRIVLPDASVVLLSSNSRLHYLPDFGLKTRKVYLEGKAAFKVAKDGSRPFSVLAGQVTTTALGTSFTVSTLRKNQVLVKLSEGLVVVHTAGKGKFPETATYLKPGDQLKINRISGLLTLSKKTQVANPVTNTPLPLSTLEFKQEQLAVVLKSLEKQYQIRIRFNPADLNGLSFTGSVRPTDGLNEILDILCTMNGLEFTAHHNKITIRKPEN